MGSLRRRNMKISSRCSKRLPSEEKLDMRFFYVTSSEGPADQLRSILKMKGDKEVKIAMVHFATEGYKKLKDEPTEALLNGMVDQIVGEKLKWDSLRKLNE